MPFEVPENWIWIDLNSICSKIVDGDHNPPSGEDRPTRYRMLSSKNINCNTIVDIDDCRYLSEQDWKICHSRTRLNKGDVLLTTVATLGRSCVVETDEPICFQRSVTIITTLIYNKYLKYIFDSNYYQELMTDTAKGTAQKGFYINQVVDSIIPLPPLAEQMRIVHAVSQWISFIDSIESSTTDLFQSIQSAKSKILDLAIHGKLVPQDASDEPASELLKRINPKAVVSCDNPQYGKVPSGWVWCKIEDIFKVVMGQSPNGDSVNHKFIGVEFHQGKIFFSQCIVEKSDVYTTSPTKLADKDSLLVCVRAPVGDVNITDREICIGRGLCALKPLSNLPLDYWFYAIKSLKAEFNKKATGSTFLAISALTIKNQVISLPPYKEQLRIVSKVNELFSQLDTIEKSLQA